MTTRLSFSGDAFRQLLLDPKVQAYMNRIGEDIARQCGDGYEYRPPTRNRRRDRGVIVPVTIRAKRSNAKHMTMVRVVTAYRAS